MSDERLNKLEMIADRHDRDLTLIASSIEKLVVQSEKTNEMIHQALLRDERFDNKLAKCELSLSNRIDQVHQTAEVAHKRLNKIDNVLSRLNWLVITFVVLAVLGGLVTYNS